MASKFKFSASPETDEGNGEDSETTVAMTQEIIQKLVKDEIARRGIAPTVQAQQGQGTNGGAESQGAGAQETARPQLEPAERQDPKELITLDDDDFGKF
jgi:hypothetical protein